MHARKSLFPPLSKVLGVGAAPWMGEAALHGQSGVLQARQGWLRRAPSSLAPTGLFFVCPQHETTSSGPSWAAAVCRLLLPCGGRGWRAEAPSAGQGPQPDPCSGARGSERHRGAAPTAVVGAPHHDPPPHQCPAALHGPVPLPTPCNGRVWPGWVPQGLLRAIFGINHGQDAGRVTRG